MKFQRTEKVFAVILKRHDGSEFIASSLQGGPAFFYTKKRATDFQRELAENGLLGRVAQVQIAIEECK